MNSVIIWLLRMVFMLAWVYHFRSSASSTLNAHRLFVGSFRQTCATACHFTRILAPRIFWPLTQFFCYCFTVARVSHFRLSSKSHICWPILRIQWSWVQWKWSVMRIMGILGNLGGQNTVIDLWEIAFIWFWCPWHCFPHNENRIMWAGD